MKRSHLALLCVVVILQPLSYADETTQIVIETEILEFDPQAGPKSRQVIQVDFGRKRVLSTYATGTTDFFGIDLSSVRDNFKVADITFSTDGIAKFTVSGQTASGVRAFPAINYKFHFTVVDGGELTLSGCHDGYPAYRVIVEGDEKYSFEHEAMRLLNLFGECDIDVRK